MSDLFYIQNDLACVGNEALWWREGGHGYTARLSDAGKFTKTEADSIHESRATDVLWPCAETEALAYRAVDIGDLRHRLRARQAMEAKLMDEKIYPGGLMRCCIESLVSVSEGKTDAPQDGDEVACQYCTGSMVWRGDGWRWNEAG